MSQQPPKPTYGAVPASQRRAARKAKLAQQAAARRSFSVTGADPQERQQRAAERERQQQKTAKTAQTETEMTAYLLAHPTKTVTEDELRTTYQYVAADLRSMGILALALVVLLVVLAQILPR